MKLSVRLRYGLLAAPLAMLMAIAPFVALGAMLFGGFAWALFKPNSAPRWTFVVVGLLSAMALAQLLPNWFPQPGSKRVEFVPWRLAFLRLYPAVVASTAFGGAWLALRAPTWVRRWLPLGLALAALGVWFVLDFETWGAAAFDVLFVAGEQTLFRIDDAPPPDYDGFIVRRRAGLYLLLAAFLAAWVKGIAVLVASYRRHRRDVRANAARLGREIEADDGLAQG